MTQFDHIATQMKALIVERDNGADVQDQIDALDSELTSSFRDDTDTSDIDRAIARMG